jgi:carbonic anhydrase
MNPNIALVVPLVLCLAVPTVSAAPPKAKAAVDKGWSYSGKTGPANWAKVEKDAAACSEGMAQSPIDIPDAKVRKGDFPTILFNYKPSPLTVVDDGHEIVVKFAPGSAITLEGGRFELVSLNFHKPAEHKVDGKTHAMEAHLVHRAPDGKTATLALFIDPGKDNPAIKQIAANLPQGKGHENSVSSVTINPLQLLPDNKDYYGYKGSLTQPPCTENVEWVILKSPITMSSDEIARLSRAYPMNARPVQPINGRDIWGSR